MTRDAVRAEQEDDPGKIPQLTRVIVRGIADQTVDVELPGGARINAPRIAGAVYAVGALAYTIVQEPAVGPVSPIGPGYALVGSGTYSSGWSDFGGGFNTLIRKNSSAEVTVNFWFRKTSSISQGDIAFTLLQGQRPIGIAVTKATIWDASTGWGGYADVTVGVDGAFAVQHVSKSGTGLFGSIHFPTV